MGCVGCRCVVGICGVRDVSCHVMSCHVVPCRVMSSCAVDTSRRLELLTLATLVVESRRWLLSLTIVVNNNLYHCR